MSQMTHDDTLSYEEFTWSRTRKISLQDRSMNTATNCYSRKYFIHQAICIISYGCITREDSIGSAKIHFFSIAEIVSSNIFLECLRSFHPMAIIQPLRQASLNYASSLYHKLCPKSANQKTPPFGNITEQATKRDRQFDTHQDIMLQIVTN